MTPGAVHSFIGTRGELFHGKWQVLPTQKGGKAITSDRIEEYLKKEKTFLIMVPPGSDLVFKR